MNDAELERACRNRDARQAFDIWSADGGIAVDPCDQEEVCTASAAFKRARFTRRDFTHYMDAICDVLEPDREHLN